MQGIPPHRVVAFRGVVDALDGLTTPERRRVLAAVLALLPDAPAPTPPPATPPPSQRPIAKRRVQRARHCVLCGSTAHDRRTCPMRAQQQSP